MDFCRNALRTLSVALIIGLGFFSGAVAQSGDPIRIGMSLALTGAGASPSKVINTALEIWRDDINAKSGLLGRPVELVIYDDQSSPANVPNIYTKLITVDKVDLLLGPYGTNFVAPAMPTIINNQKDGDHLHRNRHQRQIQLPEILFDGVNWPGGHQFIFDRLF
jgi:branched-chain amino acid transport system substrate-binding protein